MKNSKAQIIATIGPASSHPEILKSMIENNLDAVRMNFSWSDLDKRKEEIKLIRELSKGFNRRIPIIADLPGPRIQEGRDHTYEKKNISAITLKDIEFLKFAAEHGIEYVAVSFVTGASDIEKCRSFVKQFSGKQKIIAKIERKMALEFLGEIIDASDAVMVARGDLGNEVPLERMPFIQDKIIKMCKKSGKPVIVATQMLLSMVEKKLPTRAEVTDVAYAILEGSDAVMLSEETASGKYPVEAIIVMKKIVLEAERHIDSHAIINPL
ncbi:hypothetical protein HYZ82_00235 [Candidatus Nomurabacteria bacterium]|nr:hypothetical protein [Candidatus Nomurabacteria bacterium]